MLPPLQIVGVFCALASLTFGAINAWQNVRIELRISQLRNELFEEKIAPLQERVTTLEVQMATLTAKAA